MSGPTVRRDQLFARYQYADGSLSSSVIPRFGVIQGTTGRRCRDCAMASSACAQCVGQSMPKSRCWDVTRSLGSDDHTRMAETVFYPSFEFPARVGGAVSTAASSQVALARSFFSGWMTSSQPVAGLTTIYSGGRVLGWRRWPGDLVAKQRPVVSRSAAQYHWVSAGA